MGNIIDRALDIINDHLKDQTSSFQVASPLASGRAMAQGGEVLQDEYPTHYLPHVGRQVMADGGMPDDPVGGAISTAQSITEQPLSIPPVNPAALTGKGFEGKVTAPVKQSGMTRRGQVLHPRTQDPTPEDLAAARADTRTGGDIVNKRLDTIIPESSRVVGGTYTPGAPGGGRWADLGDDFLKQPGLGFKFTQSQRDAERDLEQARSSGDEAATADAQKRLDDAHKEGDDILHKLWEESVNESSAAAKDAVKKHGVVPKFLAKDWDKAMRLPLQDHLWYELSGEKMGENMPELHHDEFMKAMDLIGATSARAKPTENLERALGVLSQHMRGVPADVDITIPETVRQALSRDHRESSALPGNKTGHFSDTLALTGGIPTRFPISVNDVWVGKMFGVPDDVMSGNQSLHEPMALYFNKIRDLYNANHPEKPFTYQSWNFQAPAWVHLRGEEAGEESGDAYHQVWNGLIGKLKKAGVVGISGEKIGRDAFMDPAFSDALRRTTSAFRNAPKATIEFGTKLTEPGAQAHALYDEAIQRGDTLSQSQYLKGLVTAMYQSARGKHPWDSLKKALTGNLSTDITRISHPKSSAPLDTGGTFEAAVSPNIRVPLKDMDDDHLEAFNAIVGKHLRQKAMAISTVIPADEKAAPKAGHIRGYSLFVPTTEQIHHDDIHKLSTSVFGHGHDMSYDRYPNGYRFDVIPKFNENGAFGIDRDDLEDAAIDALGGNYKGMKVLPHDFKSVYTEDTDYDRIRKNSIERMQNDFIEQAVAAGISKSDARKAIKSPKAGDAFTGGSKKAWNNYRSRIGHLSDAEKGFKALAQRVEDSNRDFISSATKRFAKPAKAYGGAINPIELRYDDLEDTARRLILWSYAAAPIVRPLSRAEGGSVDDPVNKALDIVGAVSSPASAVDTARNLTPMGFYSAAAEAASKIPQRAPIDQIINKIRGQANVKAAELDNANLADAFAGQKSVDPKEVARHLQENIPQIKERVYGGSPAVKYEPKALLERPKGFENTDDVYEVGPQGKPPHLIAVNGNNFDVWGPSGYHNSFDSFNDAVEYANQSIHNIEPPLYGEYTIPGGKNYREVVMALPQHGKTTTKFRVTGALPDNFNSREEAENYIQQMQQMGERNPGVSKKLAQFPMDIVEESRPVSEPYKSSHWMGIQNPLAHLRMSDRDNGKTLHVEEVQSDWGQEGRQKGFKSVLTGDEVKQYDALNLKRRELEKLVANGDDADSATQKAVDNLSFVNRQMEDLSNKMTSARSGLPAAPYVTDTNQWVDLGLKRALMEAAKGGYDKVVVTPGEAQADRYDLSKRIKKIVYDPDDKTLSYMEHGGIPGFETMDKIPGNVEPHEIENHIGKEAAAKLLATEPHKLSGNHILEGEDLKVGGKGMNDFYDKLVPQRLNKLIAQYDPSAKVAINSYPLSYKVGTGRTEDIDWEGRPVEEMVEKKVNGHVLHITPKLRTAILKGLPAFKAGGDVGESPIIDHAFKVLSKLPR